MPNLGLNAAHGAHSWADFVLERLGLESIILRSGARRINVTGAVAHVPRVLTNGTASWTAELTEITSSAPTGDELVLAPKKLANVVSLSNESVGDSPADELDVVGNALTRAIATEMDSRAFSSAAATAVAPAGLLSLTLPTQTGGAGSIDSYIRAVGTIQAAGGNPNAIYVNPADLTTLRLVKEATGSAKPVLQPDLQERGAERIAGAILYPTPGIAAGTALVADASQIVVGVRKDATVDFSAHQRFSADAVVARVVARADWAVNDVNGLVKVTV